MPTSNEAINELTKMSTCNVCLPTVGFEIGEASFQDRWYFDRVRRYQLFQWLPKLTALNFRLCRESTHTHTQLHVTILIQLYLKLIEAH